MTDRSVDDLMMLMGLARDGRTTRDGVNIDLRYVDLDPAVWEATTRVGHSDPLLDGGPRLIFPWTMREDRERLLAHGGAVTMEKGDLLEVDRVEVVPVAAPFDQLDDPTHREVRLAHLRVVRSSGLTEAVSQPVRYHGVGAVLMGPGFDYPVMRRALVTRLAVAVGVDDVAALVGTDFSEWSELAKAAKGTARAALVAYLHAEEGDEDARDVFGYLMGRIEAEEQLLPKAKRGLANQDQRQRASQRAAHSNRGRGERYRDHAKEIIRNHPNISLGACAQAVATRFDRYDAENLKRVIKELFEWREELKAYRPTPAALADPQKSKG